MGFRTGKVTSVDADKHTARVQFSEPAGGYESHDLQVGVPLSGDYALPAVDALVLCAVEDGPEGIGYVLCSLYSDSNAPPLSDAGQRSIASDDLRLGDPLATMHAAIAEAVKDRLDTIQSTFDAHIHTTTATIGPSAVVGIISPPTSSIGALADVESPVKVAS